VECIESEVSFDVRDDNRLDHDAIDVTVYAVPRGAPIVCSKHLLAQLRAGRLDVTDAPQVEAELVEVARRLRLIVEHEEEGGGK